MDQYDRKIIRELQQNGRITNQQLSERINLSPSPCLKRLRDLEASGMIQGYTALVDQEAFGLAVTAFVRITLADHSETTVKRFEGAIKKLDEVQDCYMTAGQADYILRIIIGDLAAYETFVRSSIHNIPGVQSIDTSFAYSVVKRSTIFPSPD